MLDSSKGTPERETKTRENRNSKFQEMYNKIFESNVNTFKTTFLQANKQPTAAAQRKINFFSPGANAEYNHTSINASKRASLFSPEMKYVYPQKPKIMVDTEIGSKKRERLHNEMVKLKDSFFVKSSRAGNASEASSNKYRGIFSCNKSFLKKTTSIGVATCRIQSSVSSITQAAVSKLHSFLKNELPKMYSKDTPSKFKLTGI